MSAFTLPPCVLEPPAGPSTQLLHVFHQRQRGSSMGTESPSPWIILPLSDILPDQKAACPLKAMCSITSPFPNRPDSRDRMAVSILEHGATPGHLNSVRLPVLPSSPGVCLSASCRGHFHLLKGEGNHHRLFRPLCLILCQLLLYQFT